MDNRGRANTRHSGPLRHRPDSIALRGLPPRQKRTLRDLPRTTSRRTGQPVGNSECHHRFPRARSNHQRQHDPREKPFQPRTHLWLSVLDRTREHLQLASCPGQRYPNRGHPGGVDRLPGHGLLFVRPQANGPEIRRTLQGPPSPRGLSCRQVGSGSTRLIRSGNAKPITQLSAAPVQGRSNSGPLRARCTKRAGRRGADGSYFARNRS